jgi:GNAT superfamily N-acetyltransferase
MLRATLVTNDDELLQVCQLNFQNLKQNLSFEIQEQEGFVTWLYSIDLLKKMHELAPNIIIKDKGKVIAYALTTLKEAASFHPDLKTMFHNLETVQYKDKPLSDYSFYCMGQICVGKDYRGKGLSKALYQKHKEVYSSHYHFLLTEISTRNYRSMKAHEKIGFQSIYTYSDAMDEWNVVVWDWN